jgi:hypothetical protein
MDLDMCKITTVLVKHRVTEVTRKPRGSYPSLSRLCREVITASRDWQSGDPYNRRPRN